MRGKCKGSSLLNAALTVWLAAMFATARPQTYYAIAEGEQHNFQASKEQAIQHHEYLHAKSLVKGRMRERIEATKHQRSRWLAASVQCILRNETTDEEAQRVLSWLCDADGAGHSCHGIKEGGSHHHPVHPKDHLEWTMTSLHEMHEGKNNHGHSTCWFGGIAYLVPPPVNELFLELPSGSDSIAPGAMLLLRSEGDTIEGRLVRSGGENMSLCRDVQVLKAGESIAFEAKNYHAVADRMRKKATFEIHVRGDVIGAVLLAEVCARYFGYHLISVKTSRLKRGFPSLNKLNGCCGSYLQRQLIQNAFKMHYASTNINVHFSLLVQLSLCPLKGSGICHKHACIFRNTWKMAGGAIFPLIILPSI